MLDEIGELFINAVNQFYENDTKARNFGTDTELFHSEIHMLQCIEENSGIHISGIARLLGVTRGAASQTAMRLERKEMIVKESSPDSAKRVILKLTTKGKTAVINHINAHKHYNGMICELLEGAEETELFFLKDFLINFSERLKKLSEGKNL